MKLLDVRNAITALGGRRFLLTVAAGVGSSAFFALGILTEGGYITLQLATVATYIGASTVQKVKSGTPDA